MVIALIPDLQGPHGDWNTTWCRAGTELTATGINGAQRGPAAAAQSRLPEPLPPAVPEVMWLTALSMDCALTSLKARKLILSHNNPVVLIGTVIS